jgi:hypothetical protein
MGSNGGETGRMGYVHQFVGTQEIEAYDSIVIPHT